MRNAPLVDVARQHAPCLLQVYALLTGRRFACGINHRLEHTMADINDTTTLAYHAAYQELQEAIKAAYNAISAFERGEAEAIKELPDRLDYVRKRADIWIETAQSLAESK
jgi:hypothetical protein